MSVLYNSVMEVKLFTREMVETEASADNLLVIYKNKVYDLTDFADDHPGGAEILLEFCGKDVTEIMSSDSVHVHSDVALDMMPEFVVGEITTGVIGGAENNSVQSALDGVKGNQGLFDHSKPLFAQLWNMKISKDVYVKLIHKPHHSKESFRFFENDFMEILSRTHWWVIPLVWLPVIYFMFNYSSSIFGAQMASVYFVVGIFAWTLIEYSLHRFLFHLDENLPDVHLAIILHFTLHGVHHYFPMDKLRLVFPPALAAILTSLIFSLFCLIMPRDLVIAILTGGIFGYVCYDLCHYYLHHGTPIFHYLKFLKSYHLDHHYKNYHLGYGITSTFWDDVFHTRLDTKYYSD